MSDGTVGPRFKSFATIFEQRPGVDGDNRRLMGPLLGKFTAAVNQTIKAFLLIRTETGKDHEIMRGNQDIDEVELQQTKLAHDPPNVPPINSTPGACTLKSLCGQRDTPGFPLR